MRCSIGHSPAGKRLELWAPAPHRAPPPPPPSPPGAGHCCPGEDGKWAGEGAPPHRATHPTRPAAHLSVGGTRTHGCARAVLGDRAEAGDAIPPCAARVQREGQGPRQSARR